MITMWSKQTLFTLVKFVSSCKIGGGSIPSSADPHSHGGSQR